MKKVHYIIIGLALLLLSCGDGKGGKINQPYDGGHGIGIDTEAVKQIQQYEDSIKAQETIEKEQD